ncbi:hypothetical protein Pst134EA_013586 [Puccinia striiformis f. sp. tritici]|uniref:Ammonium transporter n=1 Tax=Puccinia striiformis f. sp. tritici PST-78 TaxID=1165861 RepID=A0A0L0VW87_9BASI|nr:hypothetical protein Pst134EA_013586 [Puccinia striiformis f. sp. tritici]KAI9603974.1 hypothetical protein H4Q26_003583 [Puccinia striiformis f. sp. tritici PST-130]KNF03531.1 hypothetical protein PSTG_03466 [Puccinia striiformis f. sp. tritici PST-78]KAH9454496.1 hypothetical protein Pst134EB_014574 [Puccinia striiformis f. sp. tritici]KAH9465715.1 hypothetical protein Pst134EA_013586 [Puccinia striiformis f. sp. tritici]KAI9612400.1 hypothetical protein KEM48_004131 [Puccinia striiformis
MPLLTYGSLADTNSTMFTGPESILSTKGTDVIALESDGRIYAYDPGDIAWVLICAAMTWLIVPGFAFVYSGMVRGKNALSLLLLALLAMAVVSIQFWFWGFSLAFSHTASFFIGNLDQVGYTDVFSEPDIIANNRIPQIVFAMIQQMQAAIVGAVSIGSAAERGRIGPTIIFMFFWATLVYCPISCWIYNPNGWAYKWGVLDYSGGVSMELCAGMTGLAYSLFIGRRRGYGVKMHPHNVPHVALGTTLLWFGWMGLSGGGTLANVRGAMVMLNTHLAACAGGLTFLVMDFRLERKWSLVGFCLGAICGLVAIAAPGFIGPSSSIVVGIFAAAVSNLTVAYRDKLPWDDGLDIFAGHATSGIVGVLLTGIFAQKSIASSDGFTVIDGGLIDKNWKQMYKQLAWVAAGGSWSFIVTYLIMMIINRIPFCSFRVDSESEVKGIDEDQSGEAAYARDSYFHRPPTIDAKKARKFKSGFSRYSSHVGPQSWSPKKPKSSEKPRKA